MTTLEKETQLCRSTYRVIIVIIV